MSDWKDVSHEPSDFEKGKLYTEGKYEEMHKDYHDAIDVINETGFWECVVCKE